MHSDNFSKALEKNPLMKNYFVKLHRLLLSVSQADVYYVAVYIIKDSKGRGVFIRMLYIYT